MKKDIINEITTIFKKDRLSSVSKIDRSYMQGWIDCSYYDETINLVQRDELYKKCGIE